MRERIKLSRKARYRTLVTVFLLVTVFGMLAVQPAQAAATNSTTTSTTTSEPSLDVTITYATYTDLDCDSYSDDIVVVTRFELGYIYFYYEFAYLITLQLPSGTNYTYLVYVLAFTDVVIIENLFFDHATESGDYTVYVHAVLYTPGSAADYEHYVFDPPGGSEGGKPTFGVR